MAAISIVAVIAPSPARGAVTIGQASSPTTLASCGPDSDWLQPTVTSGTAYVVPGTGTITSWTMFGGPSPGDQITMKIWRAVSGQADTFRVIGHAGPQTITPGGITGNTFPANVRVDPGDILGFHTGSTFTKCSFDAPGETYRTMPMSDIQDGQSGQFPALGSTNFRLNIEASFIPDNSFNLASVGRNRKNGTATLSFDLPNPGTLVGSGKGAKVSATSPVPQGSLAAPNGGPSQLLVKAKGKKRARLNHTGKVRIKLSVTYTPAGGDPNTKLLMLKLKKKI